MGREPPKRPEALTGRRLRLKVWLAMVPVAALLGFSTMPTDAQPIRYGISPGEIELVPPPGGTASAVLVVYNKAPNTARMRVAVQDLYVRPDGVADVLEPGKLSWSVARFTRVQPAEFDLEAERQMPVRIAVTVPRDARGGLYGMIVVTSTPVLQTPAAGKGTFIVVAPKLAARLLVAIRGTEVVQGAIVNMLAAPRPRGAGVAVCTLGLAVPIYGAVAVIRVVVDDVALSISPPAFFQDGTVYLPLAPLARRFQATTKFAAPAIDVLRLDGAVLTLRVDRLEVWSGDVVTTLLEAPVRLVNGVTMIPKSAVEALFDALTTWDAQEGVMTIVTRAPFQTAVAARPPRPPAASASAPVAARPFASEFQQDLTPPLTSSGYVSLGLTSGVGALTATAAVQYKSFGAPESIEGLLRVGAGNGPLDASGVVVLRNPAYTLTVGGLALDESPFTLYQQGILGVAYEGTLGDSEARYFGGSVSASSGQAYGMTLSFPPVGVWQAEAGFMYDPTAGALLTRERADREVAPGLALFGEVADGVSGIAAGPAVRVGPVASPAPP